MRRLRKRDRVVSLRRRRAINLAQGNGRPKALGFAAIAWEIAVLGKMHFRPEGPFLSAQAEGLGPRKSVSIHGPERAIHEPDSSE